MNVAPECYFVYYCTKQVNNQLAGLRNRKKDCPIMFDGDDDEFAEYKICHSFGDKRHSTKRISEKQKEKPEQLYAVDPEEEYEPPNMEAILNAIDRNLSSFKTVGSSVLMRRQDDETPVVFEQVTVPDYLKNFFKARDSFKPLNEPKARGKSVRERHVLLMRFEKEKKNEDESAAKNGVRRRFKKREDNRDVASTSSVPFKPLFQLSPPVSEKVPSVFSKTEFPPL